LVSIILAVDAPGGCLGPGAGHEQQALFILNTFL
jgi:hypothetical protein